MGMEVGGKQKVSPVPRKNPCLQQCTDLLMLQEEVCSFLQRKVGKKWSYTHAPTPGPHPSIIFCKTPCKVQRQMYRPGKELVLTIIMQTSFACIWHLAYCGEQPQSHGSVRIIMPPQKVISQVVFEGGWYISNRAPLLSIHFLAI